RALLLRRLGGRRRRLLRLRRGGGLRGGGLRLRRSRRRGRRGARSLSGGLLLAGLLLLLVAARHEQRPDAAAGRRLDVRDARVHVVDDALAPGHVLALAQRRVAGEDDLVVDAVEGGVVAGRDLILGDDRHRPRAVELLDRIALCASGRALGALAALLVEH